MFRILARYRKTVNVEDKLQKGRLCCMMVKCCAHYLWMCTLQSSTLSEATNNQNRFVNVQYELYFARDLPLDTYRQCVTFVNFSIEKMLLS